MMTSHARSSAREASPSSGIAVLTPVYNERYNLDKMIHSLGAQTVRPSIVLVCDNGSVDGSVGIAGDALKREGLDYRLTSIPRMKSIGKWNINNAYWALSTLLESEALEVDYVATIEADVTLHPTYFEKIVKDFERESDLGVACGRLDPLGLPTDDFPLNGKGSMVWGPNRVYSARCWRELVDLVDFRELPAWDTDHVILALMSGYGTYVDSTASASLSRGITPFRGLPKALVDSAHGLPLWWVLLKTVQRKDLPYFVWSSALRVSRGSGRRRSDLALRHIASVYRFAALDSLSRHLRHS